MSVKDLFLNNIEETPIQQEVSVSGTLPSWLTGTYYKSGNGKYTLPSGFQMNHLLDGYCIIFQYEIENNKIRYRSKYLNSDAYKEAMEFGKPTHAEFGTRQFPNPNKNVLSRTVSSIFPTDVTDNNAGYIFSYRDQIYANSNSFFLHRIDPDTLQSVAKIDLSNSNIITTAGRYLQDNTGATFTFVNASKLGMLKPQIIQFPAPPQNKSDDSADNIKAFDMRKHVKVVATMSQTSMTSIPHTHSFGMSENYFVALEQPFTLNLLSFIAGQIKGKSIMDCLQWNNNKDKTKFRVIDRSTSNLIKTKFISEKFFFLHILNAYEEDGYLIIDIITYKNPENMNSLLLCKLRNSEVYLGTLGKLQRFVLPVKHLKKAKTEENLVKLSCTTATAIKLQSEHILLTPETPFEIQMDFARLNEKLIGQKYRFLYSVGMFQKELHKLDFETKLVKMWKSTNDAHFVGEPFFVANPEATDEDDGIVISVATEAGKNKSMMIFLDAKSFTEIARAEFENSVTVGNHGIFVFKK